MSHWPIKRIFIFQKLLCQIYIHHIQLKTLDTTALCSVCTAKLLDLFVWLRFGFFQV